MPHILIVGKKFSGLTDLIKHRGDTYTILRDTKTIKDPSKHYVHTVAADFSSEESLLSTVDVLNNEQKIDAVITVYEQYIVSAALVGKHLNLPHLPIQSARACTDKYLMRSLFDTASEKISPAFIQVNTLEELENFANSHDFPLILKPANLAKSLLVTKSNTLHELHENYHRTINTIDAVYKKYAPHAVPKLVLEEFLEGSIHSVDAFIDADGTPIVLPFVVDYRTGYDIGFEDNFHYSRLLPSVLSQANQTAIQHCARIGIRALGMKSSAAHVEVILTKNGPRIVEIGARNGGYRQRMHTLANNVDVTSLNLDLMLGKKPIISHTKNEHCAVLELFPKSPGIFQAIAHEAQLQQLPSLVSYTLKVSPGDYVGKAADGYKMCAIIMLHSSNHEQFTSDLTYVDENVYVETIAP